MLGGATLLVLAVITAWIIGGRDEAILWGAALTASVAIGLIAAAPLA